MNKMFSTPQAPAQGISAVKAISLASAQGQKIWTINQDNLDTALAEINLATDTESEIRNSVNAGRIVTTHEQSINFNGWVGEGYIILDPETGAGAYKIAGGGNGGDLKEVNKSTVDIASTISASPALMLLKQPKSSILEKATFFGFIECDLERVKMTIAVVLAIAVIALFYKRLIKVAIQIPELGIKASTLISGLLISAMTMAGAEDAENAVNNDCRVGDCTVDEHRELEDKKDEFCSQSFSCNNSMSESVLAERSLIALACAEARKEIMDRCFDGGDEGHNQIFNDTMKAYENCLNILSEK